MDVTEQSVEVFPAVRRGFAPFHRTALQVLKYPVFVQTLRANAAPTQATQLSRPKGVAQTQPKAEPWPGRCCSSGTLLSPSASSRSSKQQTDFSEQRQILQATLNACFRLSFSTPEQLRAWNEGKRKTNLPLVQSEFPQGQCSGRHRSALLRGAHTSINSGRSLQLVSRVKVRFFCREPNGARGKGWTKLCGNSLDRDGHACRMSSDCRHRV